MVEMKRIEPPCLDQQIPDRDHHPSELPLSEDRFRHRDQASAESGGQERDGGQSQKERLNAPLLGEDAKGEADARSTHDESQEPAERAEEIERTDAGFPRIALFALDHEQDGHGGVGNPEEAEERVEEGQSAEGLGEGEADVRGANHEAAANDEGFSSVRSIGEPSPQEAPEDRRGAGQR